MSIDTRTEAERAYDELKDGSAYAKPADTELAIARECDQVIAEDRAAQFLAGYQAGQELGDLINQGGDEAAIAAWTDERMPASEDGPEELQIERHTHMSDGGLVPIGQQWTEYTLGEASIAIIDAGGGNVVIDREMLEFTDNAQLLDLATLLADERVLEALDPTNGDAKADDGPWGGIIDIITTRAGDNGQGDNWTDFRAGAITLTIQHHGYVPPKGTPYMLEILGHDIDGPWTIAMLQQLHTDLGNLLSDNRVVSAVAGDVPAA
jgi:hypothetical protein